MKTFCCRGCATGLDTPFLDLGMQPLSNRYLAPSELTCMEPFYPLRVFFCPECYLVQLEEFESPEAIFGDYAYFSSYSDSWLEHARRYVDDMVQRFDLSERSRVVEIASNDGYLLRNFVQRGIPSLGVEPARNVAEVAREAGIPTVSKFFGRGTAQEIVDDGGRADLVIGNNVLAHVPDLDDFVGGLSILVAPDGVLTMEFPHLARLLEENQFDTIYHEHFSYFSLLAVEQIFAQKGMTVWDVDELPTHGGSLRIYVSHASAGREMTQRVHDLREREQRAGLRDVGTYDAFARRVEAMKRDFLDFFIQAKRDGKQVVGYGAPAKGNTMLNYCGIRSDFMDYTVDRSPHKQGHFLPGSHIPIRHPDMIGETKPDYVCILPWNLKDEVRQQLSGISAWGGMFVVLIPLVDILSDTL
ncbi:MAG: methyltransferase domain-containing protein [Gemmatimonadaceae bacterium]